MNTVHLEDLLKSFPIKKIMGYVHAHNKSNVVISGITCDSRQVKTGFLFVAIAGLEQDGHRYIHQAIAQGAVAIVASREDSLPESATQVPVIIVEDTRKVLALLAAKFYQNPSEKMRVVGITGTNGKTTTTYLIEALLNADGREVGVIGTVNCRYAGHVLAATHTTPESVDLQKMLAAMQASGVTDVVMEVSSHALSMDRVLGIDFDVVAFTNLTQDHLDYHQSFENYFESKKKLFTKIISAGKKKTFSVIHTQDNWGQQLVRESNGEVVSVNVNAGDVSSPKFKLSDAGIVATIALNQKNFEISSPLLGQYNLENILVAIGVVSCLGVSSETMARALKTAPQVPGRLERIENKKGIHVFVDYAHTPDALRRVGEQLKSLAQGKVITVFGCGGDRDKTKRPLMAQEAMSFSDVVIVTSDNPRTENPEKILDDVMAGFQSSSAEQRKNIYRLADRREALKKAIGLAQKDDMVLVAGKGHEDYQIIGKEKLHFSDQEVLREILKDAA